MRIPWHVFIHSCQSRSKPCLYSLSSLTRQRVLAVESWRRWRGRVMLRPKIFPKVVLVEGSLVSLVTTAFPFLT
jgi:hypothetical protein